ncbi:hypothetical protein DPEC_G00261720 [Dallia pectoralis]|uniref:Uncharacterized protein n=1 Tax=Dallia pectoralis TaxID=75939 RepID=A0ACC2FRM8_DALPE|nr:hypothetical protein DPEC_G00261720 [Dallia pectoralis]
MLTDRKRSSASRTRGPADDPALLGPDGTACLVCRGPAYLMGFCCMMGYVQPLHSGALEECCPGPEAGKCFLPREARRIDYGGAHSGSFGRAAASSLKPPLEQRSLSQESSVEFGCPASQPATFPDLSVISLTAAGFDGPSSLSPQHRTDQAHFHVSGPLVGVTAPCPPVSLEQLGLGAGEQGALATVAWSSEINPAQRGANSHPTA